LQTILILDRCSNVQLAGQYLKKLLEFVSPARVNQQWANHFQYGPDLDDRSIMIYSLWNAQKAVGKLTMTRRADKFPNQPFMFYLGGHPSVQWASISVLDIVRVAELYPKGLNAAVAARAVAAAKALRSRPIGWGAVVPHVGGLWELGPTVRDSLTAPPLDTLPIEPGPDNAGWGGSGGNDVPAMQIS